jgi:nitrate reductase alpha subunit
MRGVLMDLWREAKMKHSDPVEAWASVMEDQAARKSIQWARGKGGFRRVTWDDALEITAAYSLL